MSVDKVYILKTSGEIIGASKDFIYLTQTILNGYLQTKYNLSYDRKHLRLCDSMTNYVVIDLNINVSIEKMSLFDYFNTLRYVSPKETPKGKSLRERLSEEFNLMEVIKPIAPVVKAKKKVIKKPIKKKVVKKPTKKKPTKKKVVKKVKKIKVIIKKPVVKKEWKRGSKEVSLDFGEIFLDLCLGVQKQRVAEKQKTTPTTLMRRLKAEFTGNRVEDIKYIQKCLRVELKK